MNKIEDIRSERNHWLDQTGFWLQMVTGWKREINKVVQRSAEVAGSSEVTAKVARTAGELSELVEKLDELSMQIGYHQLTLPNADSTKSDWKFTHSLLHERMNNESEKVRSLLSEMFELEKSAYKNFLC